MNTNEALRRSVTERERSAGTYFSVLIIAMLVVSVAVSACLLPLGDSALSSDWYKYLSFSLGGVTILLVTVGFSVYQKKPIMEYCGYKKTELKYYLLAGGLFVSVFFGLANLNNLFIDFLADSFGYSPSMVELPRLTPANYVLVILTLCILPAVTEEIALRSVVQSGILSGNIIVNALIGGLLFALFHMNPAQTPYQFAVGFCFSLLSAKSKSTLPTTLAHFLNNLAVVTVEYFFPTLFTVGGWVTTAFTVLGVVCLVGIIALIIIDRSEKQEKGSLKVFFTCGLAGIVACALMWILNFAV